MKKTPHGRSSGGSKKQDKEIRNARGLRETLGGGRTGSSGRQAEPQSAGAGGSARDLDEFIASRRRTKIEPQAPARPTINPGFTPTDEEEEAAEGRSTSGGMNKPTMYMWTAEGPFRETADAAGMEESSVEVAHPHERRARAKPSPPDRFRIEREGGGERVHPGRGRRRHGDIIEEEARLKREADFKELEELEELEVHPGRGRRKKSKKKAGRLAEPAPIKGKERDREEKAPVFFDEAKGGKGRVRGKGRGKLKGKGRGLPETPSAAALVEAAGGLVEGIVKRHPDGFGFVIADNPQIPDIYIPRQSMTGVMTNDRVLVEMQSSRNADRTFGDIREIVKRAYSRIVGAYLPVDLKYGVILGEGKGWGYDLRIQAKDSMDAKEGEIVAVEIITYPSETSEFTGRVVSIIGDLEEPLNDVKRVIFGHGIPHEFSAQAKKDARKYGKAVTEKETKGRVDLRDMNLITIDGATARDFDDAICVRQSEDGFKLWVAIADVSHYVRPGTTLDDEAFERGTSTYFPNYVVPMLPEELSNELCSLNPNVDRLCFVCEMDIDFQGHISSYEFYEAVMNSKARVTYGEAQQIIDGHTPSKFRHVAENIRSAAGLAKLLMQKRYREGSLDLEIPETQVVVDESGESTDIIRSERLFAHRLIEEMMLAANICTARFLDEAEIPGIYRIHEEPFEDNIFALQRFLHNFGSERLMSGGKLQKKITGALAAFEGKPEAQILNILTLRAMQQAKYSAHNVGHFGLGFSHYSHFTSPIRRYPDLIAHRLIKSQLYPAYRKLRMDEEDLETAATMLSACEQRSVKAERQVIAIKKARFVSRFVGEEFDGIISGVVKFGIFVLLRTYDVDGLVKIEELGDDRFIFDDENLRLVGKRTGMSFNIGDPVRIQVVAADAEAGRIEFRLAENAEEANEAKEARRAPAANTKKDRHNAQKRSKAADDRRRVRKERVSKRRRKT